MHHHNQNYSPAPKESKLEGVVIAVLCCAVFALWGVLLAFGV